MGWQLWYWTRVQQAIGLLVATAAVVVFLYAILTPYLPAELSADLPYRPDQKFHESAHDPLHVDHANIVRLVGQCHGLFSADRWPDAWPRAAALRAPLPEPSVGGSASGNDLRLTTLESAALYQSDRLVEDRQKYERGTELKHNRSRLNQIRVLLLTAAATFLIGLKTLVSHNDNQVPFRSLMNGAWLPISIAALAVPVVATVYSGIIAFDDDTKTALRYARALAQLEQLHGRIAVDLASDPYLCRLGDIEYASVQQTPSAIGMKPVAGAPETVPAAAPRPVDPVLASPAAAGCILDRSQRVIAWEQRYEQIMNDAGQVLAEAGDLPRPAAARPVLPAVDQPPQAQAAIQLAALRAAGTGVDPCSLVFTTAGSETPPGGAASPHKSANEHAEK